MEDFFCVPNFLSGITQGCGRASERERERGKERAASEKKEGGVCWLRKYKKCNGSWGGVCRDKVGKEWLKTGACMGRTLQIHQRHTQKSVRPADAAAATREKLCALSVLPMIFPRPNWLHLNSKWQMHATFAFYQGRVLGRKLDAKTLIRMGNNMNDDFLCYHYKNRKLKSHTAHIYIN